MKAKTSIKHLFCIHSELYMTLWLVKKENIYSTQLNPTWSFFPTAFQWRTLRTTVHLRLLMRRIPVSLCYGKTVRGELRCTTSWPRTGTRWWPTWWRPSRRSVGQTSKARCVKYETFCSSGLSSPFASHLQGSEETKLKPQYISTLVVSLAEFVRMADRKIIASTLSQLKLELDFDSTAISQLQVVLFGFQDAVSIKHKKTLHCKTNVPPALLMYYYVTSACPDWTGAFSREGSWQATKESTRVLTRRCWAGNHI